MERDKTAREKRPTTYPLASLFDDPKTYDQDKNWKKHDRKGCIVTHCQGQVYGEMCLSKIKKTAEPQVTTRGRIEELPRESDDEETYKALEIEATRQKIKADFGDRCQELS